MVPMVNVGSCSHLKYRSSVFLLRIAALRRKIRILLAPPPKKSEPRLCCSCENGGEPEKSMPAYRHMYPPVTDPSTGPSRGAEVTIDMALRACSVIKISPMIDELNTTEATAVPLKS